MNGGSGVFDWVLAFTAPSLIVHNMMGSIINWYRDVFVNQVDPWDAVVSAFHGEQQAGHSPVLLLYRQGSQVHSRCLVRSWPPHLPWGIEALRVCSSCTPSLPMDVGYRWVKGTVSSGEGQQWTDPHHKMRQSCVRCGHISGYVTRPEWINPIPSHMPCYWLEWPLDEEKLKTLRAQFAKTGGMKPEATALAVPTLSGTKGIKRPRSQR